MIDGVKFNGESDSRVLSSELRWHMDCGQGAELRARLISDFETTYSTTTSSSI